MVARLLAKILRHLQRLMWLKCHHRRGVRRTSYRIANVTVLLGVPFTRARTATLAPGETLWGILTLSCHKLTNPGAKPENSTSPNVLPMAKQTEGWVVKQAVPSEVGTATVRARDSEGAGSPSRISVLRGPWPVPNNWTTLPRGAGLDAPFGDPSSFSAAA